MSLALIDRFAPGLLRVVLRCLGTLAPFPLISKHGPPCICRNRGVLHSVKSVVPTNYDGDVTLFFTAPLWSRNRSPDLEFGRTCPISTPVATVLRLLRLAETFALRRAVGPNFELYSVLQFIITYHPPPEGPRATGQRSPILCLGGNIVTVNHDTLGSTLLILL